MIKKRIRCTRCAALVFFLALLFSHAAVAETLLPVDEGVKDPAFFTFRARLLEAVCRRDAGFVIAALAQDITNRPGGSGGIEEFRAKWKPDSPDSELWGVLGKVLALGGGFSADGVFTAPYSFSGFPKNLDPALHGVIMAEKVSFRKEPMLNGFVLGSLSFDIVRVIDWEPVGAAGGWLSWIPIRLADGTEGYVASAYIRSPLDYRAVFAKKYNKWVMTALVAEQ